MNTTEELRNYAQSVLLALQELEACDPADIDEWNDWLMCIAGDSESLIKICDKSYKD